MTFKDYYLHQLPDENKTAFRDKIMDALEIRKSSFYYKLKNDAFTRLEQREIGRQMGIPVDELFPKSEPQHK